MKDISKLASVLVSLTFFTLTCSAAAADFSVQAPAEGKIFKLSEAKGKYVALHFLLKTECPFCLKHTHDYAKKSAAVPDVIHVFLKPDSTEEIKAWTAKLGEVKGFPHLPIYRDADAKLAEQFGIPGGYSFHGQTVHYPALVLLDPKGKEVFRYVGQNNSDRFSYEQFTAKLADIRAKAAAGQR